MKEKEIQHIREDIPITGYDPETNSFYCGDGSHILMYQIRSKDLVNADPDEIEIDCFCWAKFYKTYGKDIEIVTMLFPSNTEVQQSYWKQRLKANQNPQFQDMIERKVKELEWRETHTKTKEFYLLFFVSSKEEIPETVKLIESTLRVGSGMALLQEMEKEKMEQVWFKLANKNARIIQRSREEQQNGNV